ncbi:hypothetical protein ACFL47_00800 [Candidatus Latescibacterota bacterium]
MRSTQGTTSLRTGFTMTVVWLTAVSFLMMAADTIAADMIPVPYPVVDAPVIHSGRYHILTCGKTSVVLDGSKGMSIALVTHTDTPEMHLNSSTEVMTDAGLSATIRIGDDIIPLDQVNDPAARLEIIDQGPGRVAARVYAALCSVEGLPYGNGTVDLYVYDGRLHLAQSMYIDDNDDPTTIINAGFVAEISGKNADLVAGGSKLISTGGTRHIPFGDDDGGFTVTINNPGRASVKMGWLNNTNPAWRYLREIDENPETDELYEKWPLWITQRGNPLTWKRTDNSGLTASYIGAGLDRIAFLWARDDSLVVPSGGYTALNGFMAILIGKNALEARDKWDHHENPGAPIMKSGTFRYYNEIEGVYEIDSEGGPVNVTFPNTDSDRSHPYFVRLWNLAGSGGYDVRVNGKHIPYGLYNDGDRVEDPMVSIVKDATGPARFAGIAVTADRGANTRLTVTSKPGIQLVYQMYSGLEAYEAWSDVCGNEPLFRLYLQKCTLYNGTLPGRNEYAIAKLPLCWLKNGLNHDTFMNHLRGFKVIPGDPGELSMTISSVNLQGTGLSTYKLTVPYEETRLTLGVTADFRPLDDGKRWTSVEYCDLYPFDNVYRRTFHYDDVVFLDRNGVFDRVGTGAWSGKFAVVDDGGGRFHSDVVKREGPGSRTPDGADGTVWILGDSNERGNILYRRGDWTPSEGARSRFGLCNAWVDIHNTVVGRSAHAAGETISYTVEIFGGQVPSNDRLNEIYRSATGDSGIAQITKVKYSDDGVIEGFEVKK